MQAFRASIFWRGVPCRSLRAQQLPPVLLRIRPSSRGYATSNDDQHLVSSFSTPFAQFVYTVSRIARIILLTTTGVVSVGVLTYEGVHQYVEHVALPKSQVQSQEEDPWGWTEEIKEENWGSGKGTDARLGIRGRHVLRSAWICANWGGGILPSDFITAGAGLPATSGSRPMSASLISSDGLRLSEAFLQEALRIAEERGIRIPDLAAIRAGIQSPSTMAASKPLDWTAIGLECKLASIRERLGREESLKGALSGYTRVFDVLSSIDTTNRDMKSEGHESGQPTIRTERLVRLATKIGDLHALLGKRSEAESWLLQAISLAGHEAAESKGGEKGREGIARNQIMAGVGGLSPRPAEVKEAEEALHIEKKKSLPSTTTSPLTGPLSAEAPSPALTRSLISTLLSLSAFYAQPSNRSHMEKALQFQASALRLARVEKQRLSLSDNRNQIGPSLHSLWLTHHDGLACIHIAETIYALGSRGTASTSFGTLMNTVGLGSKSDKHTQTLDWLNEAEQNAKANAHELAKKSKRIEEVAQLQSKWVGTVQWETPAKRLLRDALRLKLTVEEMKKEVKSL